MNIDQKISLIRKELKEYFSLPMKYGYLLYKEEKTNFFVYFSFCKELSDLELKIGFYYKKKKGSFNCRFVKGESSISIADYLKKLGAKNDLLNIDPYAIASFNESSIKAYLTLLSEVLEKYMPKILKGEEWVDIPFDMRLLDEYR